MTCEQINDYLQITIEIKAQGITCNIAKKGRIGMQTSSPASAFLTWDMDALPLLVAS